MKTIELYNKFELADKVGVHHNTVNSWIKHKGLKTLKVIKSLNKVEVDEHTFIELPERFKHQNNLKYIIDYKDYAEWIMK